MFIPMYKPGDWGTKLCLCRVRTQLRDFFVMTDRIDPDLYMYAAQMQVWAERSDCDYNRITSICLMNADGTTDRLSIRSSQQFKTFVKSLQEQAYTLYKLAPDGTMKLIKDNLCREYAKWVVACAPEFKDGRYVIVKDGMDIPSLDEFIVRTERFNKTAGMSWPERNLASAYKAMNALAPEGEIFFLEQI